MHLKDKNVLFLKAGPIDTDELPNMVQVFRMAAETAKNEIIFNSTEDATNLTANNDGTDSASIKDRTDSAAKNNGTDTGNKDKGKQTRACEICGDESAYRNHYTVWSCEGCKKKFQKMVHSEAIKFECTRGDFLCPITKTTRLSCPACHFIKCVNTGMKIGIIWDYLTRMFLILI